MTKGIGLRLEKGKQIITESINQRLEKGRVNTTKIIKIKQP